MNRRSIERRSRMTVWYLKPDPEGCYLIIRRIEDWQHNRCHRVELQKDGIEQYVPYSTATVSGDTIIDITTPEWCRERGFAKRLVLMAKLTFFPGLRLSRPVTWRGRLLYRAIVSRYPDMADQAYEADKERYDLDLDRDQKFEASLVYSPDVADSDQQ